MAIEKSNQETEVEIPEVAADILPDNIVIEQDEDQTIEIIPDSALDFNNNLANLIEEDDLRSLSMDLCSDFDEDEESRREWLDSFTKGLDLLGIKTDDRTEPFPGATGVHHPLLSESVAQFQAQAYKELLPADGPVRTQILGAVDKLKEQQSQRVKEFMNST